MHQILISPIHLPTINDTFINKLMQKKVTALALEYIKDEAGTFPFVRAMSETFTSNAGGPVNRVGRR